LRSIATLCRCSIFDCVRRHGAWYCLFFTTAVIAGFTAHIPIFLAGLAYRMGTRRAALHDAPSADSLQVSSIDLAVSLQKTWVNF
jgi:hypothetical protein